MKRHTQDDVKRFYDKNGWQQADDTGVTLDTKLWGLERRSLEEYSRKCDGKLCSLFPKDRKSFLDAGSGPARRDDYVSFYNFPERYCTDFSETALKLAKQRHQEQCKYVVASLTALPFQDESFDTIVNLHVIYHIPKGEQEDAVRELIRVAKTGKPVIIAYRNPWAPFDLLQRCYRALRLNAVFGGGEVYFYTHPLHWWHRFLNSCNIERLPLFPLPNRVVRLLVPDNRIGRIIFSGLSALEDLLPNLCLRLWSYTLIVLKKKREDG